MSLVSLQIQVLQLLREATSAGIVAWDVSKDDSDWFFTTKGPVDSYIHFKWPSYNGEVGSDRDFVEVGGAGRFMIGTEGWALAIEILASSDLDDWKNHYAAIRGKYEQQIDLLTQALKSQDEEPRTQ